MSKLDLECLRELQMLSREEKLSLMKSNEHEIDTLKWYVVPIFLKEIVPVIVVGYIINKLNEK